MPSIHESRTDSRDDLKSLEGEHSERRGSGNDSFFSPSACNRVSKQGFCVFEYIAYSTKQVFFFYGRKTRFLVAGLDVEGSRPPNILPNKRFP